MKDITIHEVIALVAGHYGVTKTDAMEIMRTPTHPKTMRDDFAKSAMQGYLARNDSFYQNIDSVSSYAYKVADSMLKEREKC